MIWLMISEMEEDCGAGFPATAVGVGVGLWGGTAVEVGVALEVAVGSGEAGVAVAAMPVAVGVAACKCMMAGAIHRARSSSGVPKAETLRTNSTLIPARLLKSISALEYMPS